MQNTNKYNLGIDIGSSTVKIAIVNTSDNSVAKLNSIVHNGNINKNLLQILENIPLDIASNIENIAITGSIENAQLQEILKSSSIMQVLAVPSLDKACELLYPQAKTILEIGAQNAKYIKRQSSENSSISFAVSEGCASGTGAFLEQQVSRVGLELEAYQDIIDNDKKHPTLSGHCSVFTKTDIIHRQQEGYTSKEILAGICFATIRNIKTNLVKDKNIHTPLLLSGSVSKNKGIIQALIKTFDLQESDIIFDENTCYLQAIGTATLANKSASSSAVSEFINKLKIASATENSGLSFTEKLIYTPIKKELIISELKGQTHCILGIDVGSTSINLVLIDEEKKLISSQYLRTAGKPKEVVLEGIENIKKQFADKVIIDEIGVTGSGRNIIAKMLEAKTVKDEITSQAKCASFVEPNVDTVFEIGGQDSKYISISNQEVVDFQMNKICAAGTGSFLEEQAKYLNIDINDYAKLALEAKTPVELGERCTVFIENNIASCLALGIDKKDILAGLCHSIIRNYLGKVVGNRKVGSNILLQGGVCYNDAVVAAFQYYYGDKVKVSPLFSVSGAFGVALLALEEKENSKNREPIQNNLLAENKALFAKSKEYLMQCYKKPSGNKEKSVGIPMVLMFYRNFPLVYTFFNELGFDVYISGETDNNIAELAQEVYMTDTCYPIKLAHGHIKKLVDMNLDYILLPRVSPNKGQGKTSRNSESHTSSNSHQMQSRNQKNVQQKQEETQSFIKGLLQKSIPYLIEILPASTVSSFANKMMHKQGGNKQKDSSSICPFMQSFPELIKNSNVNQGSCEFIEVDMSSMMSSNALLEIGTQLGKSENLCKKACDKAFKAFMTYMMKNKTLQENFISKINPNEKILVVVTRFYNLADSVLEMGIIEQLLNSGYKVISSSHLPLKDMAKNKENKMDYPFGHHMLVAAEFIKNNPNYYPIYLTNHGCGHDTMISHEFLNNIGDKACLSVEIDEHFSKVGLITRVEAFLNSIDKQENKEKANKANRKVKNVQNIEVLQKDMQEQTLFIPYLFPYSALLANFLSKQNYTVEELPPHSEKELKEAYDKCNSKEYLSFVFNLMDSVYLKNNNKEGSLLVFRTKQSDADAMYANVIANMSSDNININSLYFEDLFTKWQNSKELFYAFLGGDIIMNAQKNQRDELLNNLLESSEITEDRIIKLASNITHADTKKVMLIGEPKVLFNHQIYKNILNDIEEKNIVSLQFMPLSEFLLYVSNNIANDDKAKYQKSIVNISEILGKNSPFICDFLKFEVGMNAILPEFQAANGKYRLAKAIKHENCNAIIYLASLYENTQTVISSFANNNKPLLSLAFDGRDYSTQKEKLNSFLFYL